MSSNGHTKPSRVNERDANEQAQDRQDRERTEKQIKYIKKEGES